ncbi:MAG: hypothetical protein O3B24_04800 [Verrucomicrobia bacterium]|nr:hypothetical protein [Verrucomicrobiota bacterium]
MQSPAFRGQQKRYWRVRVAGIGHRFALAPQRFFALLVVGLELQIQPEEGIVTNRNFHAKPGRYLFQTDWCGSLRAAEMDFADTGQHGLGGGVSSQRTAWGITRHSS